MRFNFKILFVFALITVACNRKHYLMSTSYTREVLIQKTPSKKAEEMITPFKHKVDSTTNSVVVLSEGALTKDGNNSSLGNFVCDAVYSLVKDSFNLMIDAVLLNKGGLRANLPKGEIKISNLFELMPFENELVVLSLSGKQLLEGSKRIIEKKAVFKGLKLNGTIENYSISIQQKPLKADSNYVILTSDYLATGGDNYEFLKEASKSKFLNLKLRDALIIYCKKVNAVKQKITPYTDDRFSIN